METILDRDNFGRYAKGHSLSETTQFKKGHRPYNADKNVELICQYCGEKYTVQKYREQTSHYCSHKCAGLARFKGSNHPQWGKVKLYMVGENNPNWNGGTSINNKNRHHQQGYANWRRRVFDRDGYTCQNCGKTNCFLEAHHIISWKDSIEKRFDIDNGITLCKECHAKLDKFRKLGGCVG